ncbi:MAG: hypothetical protein HY049_17665 [Acidobacteria bacterium]|nr:hypothetical protein [Acidobacteriota bacterium]
MEATGTTILLLARLLLTGPDGMHALSEHRARIPLGATGLLRETVREPGLPGAFAVSVTPRERRAPGKDDPGVARISMSLRVELWADAAAESSGKAADEVNLEEVELEAGSSHLVQVAEDSAGDRRLLLSLRLLRPDEETPAGAPLPSHLREVAFRVDAYREAGGIRELLSTHALRTLEGLPVSCQSSWTAPREASASGPSRPEEEISLTLRPMTPQAGWISVDATFSARLLPLQDSKEPRLVDASFTRTVSLGIPFELSFPLRVVTPEDDPNAPARPQGAGGDAFVVQITPYLPAAVGDTP